MSTWAVNNIRADMQKDVTDVKLCRNLKIRNSEGTNLGEITNSAETFQRAMFCNDRIGFLAVENVCKISGECAPLQYYSRHFLKH